MCDDDGGLSVGSHNVLEGPLGEGEVMVALLQEQRRQTEIVLR